MNDVQIARELVAAAKLLVAESFPEVRGWTLQDGPVTAEYINQKSFRANPREALSVVFGKSSGEYDVYKGKHVIDAGRGSDPKRILNSLGRTYVAADFESDGLNGMKNREARKFVNSIMSRQTKGFFTDQYWRPVKKILADLADNHIVALTDAEYMHDDNGIPNGKRWKVEIRFDNDKGRPTKLYGVIVASGAGSIEDPLDKYDVVAYVN